MVAAAFNLALAQVSDAFPAASSLPSWEKPRSGSWFVSSMAACTGADSMLWLGEDEFGVWLGAPIGTIYSKGGEDEVYATKERRVMLFPRSAWWTALFQAPPARLDVYCDVTTPSDWPHEGEVTTVDLDLDVCRIRQDGSVFMDDEDEFRQ